MRQDTATRRLTKRAHDFLGMDFMDYIMQFTYVCDSYGKTRIVLNDNTTMQKAFAVWVSVDNREAALIRWHQNR